jgi:hypothetical protein
MKNIASYHAFLWYTYRTTNSPEALVAGYHTRIANEIIFGHIIGNIEV